MPARILTPALEVLWQQLAGIPAIRDRFVLAGGTALAMHFGHRQSIDLDFFTPDAFDPQQVFQFLPTADAVLVAQEEGTLHARVTGCKVSFFRYPYPWLTAPETRQGLRLAGVPDIAAMKVVAIAQRGTKKDFFDLFRILQDHPPAQIKDWVLRKFSDRNINCYHLLRSLFYFDDAELDPDPLSLDGTTWPVVKAWFQAREREFFQTLLSPSS
ncbi:MAG: hypothetical protein OZSIB_4263 [Candidatus Ozemobacter sibiricus]|uniref:Nucleotidyl transferase AbiEii/AbiGii toxin family protein n=1 Tax=Candidatus Ozemobacter sibiricus TaxID=2268124 RepID=A0A367ZP26_9BACT|nr:MAG: hypothetical protein OZSIB_4263 [Candidatus Ozemobacter sibiricus]